MTAAPSLPDLDHPTWLRRAFAVAQRARAHGQHPFGAGLGGPDGSVLIEQENAYLPDRAMTGHADRVLATRASRPHAPAFRHACRLYRSAHPCPISPCRLD